MTLDTLVFDIETQNFFTDPDVGWDNYAALKISVVGVYSYIEDRYYCYEENEMDKLAELFSDARRIVGFSMNRYDIPVLNNYFQRLKGAPKLWEMERVDLLEEIEMATGSRVSLDRLAGANLGLSKTHHSSEAGALYREGKIDELKGYCVNDVKLTKELYDLYRKQNFLMVPSKKSGEVVKVEFANLAITPSLL
jgi:DEAD/DEAH box helicase domain-containing protein